ncbi:MAG: carbohydrate ABC transporter permease [Actinomycetota bacterium]
MRATARAQGRARNAGGRPTGLRPRREALVGWSFALPFLVLFVVFMAGPIAVSFVTSFTDLRVTDIRDPLNVNVVGLDNYTDVLGDPKFHKAAVNTALYVLLCVPLTMGLGLLIAVGLNQGIVKLRNVFRLGYYLPQVTSIVAIAVVWRMMLGTETGLINGLLDSVDIDGPGWLTDSRFALGSIIVMTTWRGLGLQMVIFLAGLQAIPADLLEAAAVDGAGPWQRFWRITFPLLRPTLLFSGVVATIGLLQFFEEPFVMTQGGPLDSTLSVAFHAYNQFSFGNYGYTAAISYVLFLAVAALTLIQFRLLRPTT